MTLDAADAKCELPDGEYAIVECMGHSTLIGRISEVERFGTKLCMVEPIWHGALLAPVYVAGASLYRLTPCSREVAWSSRARYDYQLPSPVRARIEPAALPAPTEDDTFEPADDADDGDSDGEFD
ncbi:MAG: hypothetical protein WDN08_05320 [Rhizomicrobium sp.]